MGIEVITADPGATHHLGRMLADAFADDPIWCWVAPDEGRRRANLASMFAAVIRPGIRAGLGFTTADDGGVAVWSAPDAWRTSLRDALPMAIPALRTIGVRRVRTGIRALGRIEALHPAEPHWYLGFLAANAHRRGRGYGSALIAPMLERADDEAMPCYLESSKEENLPFYHRFGFEVTREFRIGEDSPPMWAMWREPRTPRQPPQK